MSATSRVACVGASQDVPCCGCDDGFLVDRNDVHIDSGCIGRDPAPCPGALPVRRFIQLHAEPAQSGTDARPYDGGVLADAAAKGDSVDSAEDGGVRPEVLQDTMAENPQCESCARMLLCLQFQQCTDIVCLARQSQQTRLPVEYILQFIPLVSLLR